MKKHKTVTLIPGQNYRLIIRSVGKEAIANIAPLRKRKDTEVIKGKAITDWKKITFRAGK